MHVHVGGECGGNERSDLLKKEKKKDLSYLSQVTTRTGCVCEKAVMCKVHSKLACQKTE